MHRPRASGEWHVRRLCFVRLWPRRLLLAAEVVCNFGSVKAAISVCNFGFVKAAIGGYALSAIMGHPLRGAWLCVRLCQLAVVPWHCLLAALYPRAHLLFCGVLQHAHIGVLGQVCRSIVGRRAGCHVGVDAHAWFVPGTLCCCEMGGCLFAHSVVCVAHTVCVACAIAALWFAAAATTGSFAKV